MSVRVSSGLVLLQVEEGFRALSKAFELNPLNGLVLVCLAEYFFLHGQLLEVSLPCTLLAVPCCLYPAVCTLLSVHCLYTAVSTLLSLHCCLYTAVSTLLPVPCCLCTAA